jgi:uncharacterized membrane-anchored protein YhcB (DUF1043 family)
MTVTNAWIAASASLIVSLVTAITGILLAGRARRAQTELAEKQQRAQEDLAELNHKLAQTAKAEERNTMQGCNWTGIASLSCWQRSTLLTE